MIEGGNSRQDTLLIIDFVKPFKRSRPAVLLFESDGKLELPFVRAIHNSDLLESFDEKYGLSLSVRGRVDKLNKRGFGINSKVKRFLGIMGNLKQSDYKPVFYTYNNLDNILNDERLTNVTRRVLIFLLTKLALKGRLC